MLQQGYSTNQYYNSFSHSNGRTLKSEALPFPNPSSMHTPDSMHRWSLPSWLRFPEKYHMECFLFFCDSKEFRVCECWDDQFQARSEMDRFCSFFGKSQQTWHVHTHPNEKHIISGKSSLWFHFTVFPRSLGK